MYSHKMNAYSNRYLKRFSSATVPCIDIHSLYRKAALIPPKDDSIDSLRQNIQHMISFSSMIQNYKIESVTDDITISFSQTQNMENSSEEQGLSLLKHSSHHIHNQDSFITVISPYAKQSET